ncbi:MAG: M20/M25/M40 family metallo-hydrolase [Pseudomonadales bacterium]|jgi:acetylornithine deacetylase/succinyl-diaminopimelate desuccinylase-like protein|nr:M20/M25/M40 family metallo-hydrolase [Pseudomonadales bacterium]
MKHAITMVLALCAALSAAAAPEPDWDAFDAETLRHFEALVRMNTTDPPGREIEAAEYLVKVLEAEGIPVETFAREPHRPNVVARLPGNGSKKPILIMAHTDTVNVDPAKWRLGPFSAERELGYIYGRGTVDDKDNVVAALMAMLTLKRLNVPLDRDVIFLAESGEEGATEYGIEYMVENHLDTIDAEFCYAEGGGVTRKGGEVAYATVQTMEKIPRAIELRANGPAGHGSRPLLDNAVVHLADAVATVGTWRIPTRLNETTRTYFERLASISEPEDAQRYLDILHPDPEVRNRADDHFRAREPHHASMIRSSISPTIIEGGYRVNVIPSEARAILDTRLEPTEDPEAFLEMVSEVIDDPAIEVAWAPRNARPAGTSSLGTEAFQVLEANIERHYDTTTIPTMSTGATDMAYLRAQGIQCYGIGPAIDIEDGPKGFGAHSDQERILERELYRFARFHYDIVADIARSP